MTCGVVYSRFEQGNSVRWWHMIRHASARASRTQTLGARRATYNTSHSFLISKIAIVHCHARRIVRDRRREEETRGMNRLPFFYFALLPQIAILTHTQCYFFDSDVGGFHYGPGHPYVPVLDVNDSALKRALLFPCVVLA
jgi:hypothetical protein